ncbi:MAG TPA: hypothetical protein VK961_27345 [Chthoniobacter sp.]|nr:hypothetical protein [Chthoniobacter sp.]
MAKVSNQARPSVIQPEVENLPKPYIHGKTDARIHVRRISSGEVPRIRLIGGATVEIGLDSEMYQEHELTAALLEDILCRYVSSAGDCRTTFVIFQIMEDRSAELAPKVERLLNELAQSGHLTRCNGVSFFHIDIAASCLADTAARLDEIVGPGDVSEDVIIELADQWRGRTES